MFLERHCNLEGIPEVQLMRRHCDPVIAGETKGTPRDLVRERFHVQTFEVEHNLLVKHQKLELRQLDTPLGFQIFVFQVKQAADVARAYEAELANNVSDLVDLGVFDAAEQLADRK